MYLSVRGKGMMVFRLKSATTKKACQTQNTNMAKMAIYGTLAIRPSANNMGKWGIPEKSYENVAQQ